MHDEYVCNFKILSHFYFKLDWNLFKDPIDIQSVYESEALVVNLHETFVDHSS